MIGGRSCHAFLGDERAQSYIVRPGLGESWRKISITLKIPIGRANRRRKLVQTPGYIN